ncbi:hypothetical protein NPIL_313591 [Nephila pilipes]|uniref:EGF-like domain-containing protein n=1 Tax=Nephila pilipes TaxID=299642 RepID=A0A8X6UIE0_NEPPI|nr:hypothetical protein NPIL_516321 [Nephila pilipes]GFU17984.1 hypothetical protein NPIL_313591 [Nephila pilipes]
MILIIRLYLTIESSSIRFFFLNTDPCDPNPCKNKGRCVATQEIGENNGKRYHCRCTGQFTGNDCDIDLITFPEMPTTSAITVSTNSEEDVSPKIDEDLNTKGDLSA